MKKIQNRLTALNKKIEDFEIDLSDSETMFEFRKNEMWNIWDDFEELHKGLDVLKKERKNLMEELDNIKMSKVRDK